jgi:RIO kinase 1
MIVEEDVLVWIDFSQGVHETHPEARKLLERDVENVVKFFSKQGAEADPEKALNSVLES